jgi:hypothetical protein
LTPLLEHAWDSGIITPPFFTGTLEGSDWSDSRTGRFNPGEGVPVPIGYEAGWDLEPVWTLWRRDKYLASPGNRAPDVLSVAVAIPAVVLQIVDCSITMNGILHD